MRNDQKLESNMANAKEIISEIPAKRARLEGDLSESEPIPSDFLSHNLSNGNGVEVGKGARNVQTPSKIAEFIHFPENSGGLGHSSLDGAAQSSSFGEPSEVCTPEVQTTNLNDNLGETTKGEDSKENKEGEESNDSWSTISDISGLSEDAWKPVSGPISWVQRQMTMGTDPRNILSEMLPTGMTIPPDLDNYSMWRVIINLLMEPPKRKKLQHINTLEDVVHLLRTCKKIMVLTGAGVSVSCGIPDFRSRNGVYARLAVDFPNLPDPQAMFDIHFFQSDPRPFFKFAKEIYPGQFEPSKCHKFIKLLEDHGKLLQNYTQNIDTLEQVAGIKNVIQCHGSFATAQCMACKHKVDAEVVREDIFNQVIPKCPVCPPDTPFAIMKPNIVFFGESLPEEFHRQMAADKDECDLLIVIGSSLKVRPVALIPNSLPANVPQILINRERLRHIGFDVELLGDCDVIVNELCKRLGEGWDVLCNEQPSLQQINKSELNDPVNGTCSNNVNSYTDSCELRSDTCLATSDSNSLDCTATLTTPDITLKNNITHNNSSAKDHSNQDVPSSIDNKPSDSNNVSDLHQSNCVSNVLPEESKSSETVKDEELDVSIEKLREFYQGSARCSLAKRLKGNQFLFMQPNRYVFSGAEVYSDDDGDTDDSDEDDESDVEITSNTAETDVQTGSDEGLSNSGSAHNMKENYEVSVKEIDIGSNSLQ